MREILFRGKRVDNGEWVEGYYIGLHKTTYCFEGEAERNKENEIHQIVFEQMTDWDLPNRHLRVDVIPETVGQYTGLTDKNGKKIFEGDIVQRRNKELLLNNIFDFKIVFIPVKACFTAVDISGGNVTFISDYINNKYDIEVIGNIYDNPELLDGVRNG